MSDILLGPIITANTKPCIVYLTLVLVCISPFAPDTDWNTYYQQQNIAVYIASGVKAKPA